MLRSFGVNYSLLKIGKYFKYKDILVCYVDILMIRYCDVVLMMIWNVDGLPDFSRKKPSAPELK